jgi:hypothetical protein
MSLTALMPCWAVPKRANYLSLQERVTADTIAQAWRVVHADVRSEIA